MRITGGKARGINLQSPRGRKTRPAADSIRESLFSSLDSLVLGSRVLDLFSGTGSYGLEALSRGASQVQFVESDSGCISCIKENLKRVARSCEIDLSAVSVSRNDVRKWSGEGNEDWDILIADPPYEEISAVQRSLFKLADRCLVPAGLLVLEQPANIALEADGWVEIKRLGKKRGDGPSLSFWRRA